MSRSDHAWLLDAVYDQANSWAMGTFGAIAEFTRDPGEDTTVTRIADGVEAATARGAIRLVPRDGLRPVAYETPNRDGETWSHAVALCLPAAEAAMNRRAVLTELGPDTGAVRPQDGDAVLFDMGLGTGPVDVCIRTRESDLLAVLRAAAGRSLFEPGNDAMAAIVSAGPHRVLVGRLGRAEVFQPIPPVGGVSPDGPHTHVLPRLLRTGRTHAATTPIPDDLVPCAHLFPPNPVRDAIGRTRPFAPEHHARFQALFARFGGAEAIRLKRDVADAFASGHLDAALLSADGKHARAAARVALRQARLGGNGDARIAARLAEAFERRGQAEAAEDDEQPIH